MRKRGGGEWEKKFSHQSHSSSVGCNSSWTDVEVEVGEAVGVEVEAGDRGDERDWSFRIGREDLQASILSSSMGFTLVSSTIL